MSSFTESIVEDAALAWLGSLGYAIRFGLAIAPGEPAAERLRQALSSPEGLAMGRCNGGTG
jgi:hypothetical protein